MNKKSTAILFESFESMDFKNGIRLKEFRNRIRVSDLFPKFLIGQRIFVGNKILVIIVYA